MNFRSLKLFWQRRIQIPVSKNDIVLDIGSGDKPHWRADLLLENFPDKVSALQRSSGGAATITAPMIIGDVQQLPFKDKSIDFVIASHLLEHIPNLKAACQEIQRIGKAGYIELPYEGMAKILDLDSHLWWCKKKDNQLIFTAKQNFIFDEEIHKYAEIINNRDQWFSKIVHPNFDASIVQLWWSNSFEFKINGKINQNLMKKIQNYDLTNFKPLKTWNKNFRKLFVLIMKIIFFQKTNTKKLDLPHILQCPKCKSLNNKLKFIKNNKNSKIQYIACPNCQNKIEIRTK
jgi:uncharacterized protein YbaR (Trm112 family)